ncbi:MAG TPA: serine hydrolase domain-containing protein [Propionibacteriaceae bacterium]|nr:serine hydrolase domain-containing protein [Propionibacteriaceae bacterium]
MLEQRAVESVRLSKPNIGERVACRADGCESVVAQSGGLGPGGPGSEPGCSAAVGRRGEILWTGVAGVSNLQRRDPITADTVFDAGSVSKQFTATAVLVLQQEGKLFVDDRLSRHVDGPTGLVRSGDARPADASGQRHPRDGDILLNKGFQPQDRVKRETLRKAITAGP